MVFYRAYRPQTFADLVGQDQAKSLLIKNLQLGRVNHAFLFSGSRGSGKTSTARLIAKSLNCVPNIIFPEGKKYELTQLKFLKSGDVCGNQCPNCQAIADGSFLDLIEIDAASNRGIDEIRDLREKVRLSASQGIFKVYIIDEVHMLTNEAFNALLKTLEEPPAHVVFVLATTELQKIPATILSRTQKFEFKRASTVDVYHYLEKIATQEKLKFEKEALELIAKAADGSFRDGAKMLEQLANDEITSDRVEMSIGSSSSAVQQEVIKSLLTREEKFFLELVESLNTNGTNPKTFTNDLLDQIQSLMLIKSGLEKLVRSKETSESYDFFSNLVNESTISDMTKLAELLLTSLDQLANSPLPFLPLQIAGIKFLNVDTETTTVKLEPKVKTKEFLPATATKLEEELAEVEVVKNDKPDPNEVSIKALEVPSAEISAPPSVDFMVMWSEALKLIRPQNISLEALLRSTEPIGINGDELTIKFFYSFHKQKVNETRNLSLLNQALKQSFGRNLKIKFVMGTKIARPREEIIEELRNVTPVNDDNLLSAANDIFSSDLN